MHDPSRRLLAHLFDLYGLASARLERTAPGADSAAATFRAVGDQADWFVKVRRGGTPETGAAVCAGLAQLGRSEILSPVLSRDHDAVTHLDGSSVVVWPNRSGRNGFEAPQSPSVLDTVGQVVRAVHDAPIPPDLAAVLPHEPLDDRWRRGARQAICEVLPQHRARVERLARAADRLARPVDRRPRRWVLCHADLHAGNVLVGPDGPVTILDWDSAMFAPRERDLMFPGAAVAGTWTGDEHVTSFLRGYNAGRSVYRPDPAAVAYFRCDRICEDIVITTRDIFDPTNPNRADSVRNLTTQFEPGDAVEAAEHSLRQLAPQFTFPAV